MDVIAPGEPLPPTDGHWLSSKRVKVHRVAFDCDYGKPPLASVMAKCLVVLERIRLESAQFPRTAVVIQ